MRGSPIVLIGAANVLFFVEGILQSGEDLDVHAGTPADARIDHVGRIERELISIVIELLTDEAPSTDADV